MWAGVKSFFQSRNILVLGMALSIIPALMIFQVNNELEKLSALYRGSIDIQSKLDDIDEHIKNWVIISKHYKVADSKKIELAAETVDQDLSILNILLKENKIQTNKAVKLGQLWRELIQTDSGIDTDVLDRIDDKLNEIDSTEVAFVKFKKNEIAASTVTMRRASVLSILLSLVLVVYSYFQNKKIIKNEQSKNNQLRISEAKAIESSRLKASFLATVSHEIRTPLNGIIGLSDVLSRMNLPEEAISFVDIIHNSGKTLLRIINDILDYSKIETGKIELEISEFSVQDLVQQVISALLLKSHEKSIHLDYLIDENIPKVLYGDSSRISQILFNLVGNAIKFTNVGSVMLKVKLQEKTEHSVRIYFSISDTGIGLTQEQIGKLFQPFVQLHRSGTSGEPGTGLGLSISRQLLKQMNSDIHVESKEDEGSRFSFALEFTHFSEEKIGSQKINRIPSPIHRQMEIKPVFDETDSPTILVVEDNPTNQVTVQAMLERLGAEVIVAGNGAEALDMLSKTDVDLIFMDCQMPVMDGFEATTKIREVHGSIPIVAMTANAATDDQNACRAVGMNGFISKPITMQILADELSRTLKPLPTFISEEILLSLDNSIGSEARCKIIQTFLTGLPELRINLNKAISDNDLSKIKKIAHRYKSSSHTVGAIGLAYLFKHLERATPIEIAERIVKQILNASQDVETQLNRKLSET